MTFVYGSFCAAIVLCACMVSASSWSLVSSAPRSDRGYRTARRNVGMALCAVGFLWLLLVVQLDLQIAEASHQATAAGASSPSALRGEKSRLHCPVPVSIDGVKFGTAPTWD